MITKYQYNRIDIEIKNQNGRIDFDFFFLYTNNTIPML